MPTNEEIAAIVVKDTGLQKENIVYFLEQVDERQKEGKDIPSPMSWNGMKREMQAYKKNRRGTY